MESPNPIKLTKSNYYSNVSDLNYMSPTWFKKFEKCEASALDELINPTALNSTALLVGNFVHSACESNEAHSKFIEENKWHIFAKKKATKKQIENGESNENGQVLTNKMLSDFEKAKTMIARLKSTPEFDFFYNHVGNKKESIIAGNLYGINWKGKIDSLNVDKGYLCDLKTTADMYKTFYNPETRKYDRLWFDEYNYGLQMAAYKKLLQERYHKPFSVYIFAIDKKETPAVEAIQVDEDRIEKGLDEIQLYQPRLMKVLKNEESPIRCEHCDYCKRTYNPIGFKSVDTVVKEKFLD